jgi:hypothetical protein
VTCGTFSQFFDGTEFAEVDIRNAGDAGAASYRACGLGATLQAGLHVILHIFLHDAPFGAAAADLGQIDAEFTRQFAHGRASVNLAPRAGDRSRLYLGCGS